MKKRNYWLALWHYLLTWAIPKLEDKYHTDSGFCFYFWRTQHICLTKSNAKKLYATRPSHIKDFTLLWFSPGAKKPRIQCLLRVIFSK